jgi:hypothetical protein
MKINMPELYQKPEDNEISVAGSGPFKTASKHRQNPGTFKKR